MPATSWDEFFNVARRVYNREVDREFRDIPVDDENAIDLRVPRHALWNACRLHDNDSAPMGACKMMLFYFGLRKAQDLQTPIYGIPVPSYQEARKFKPQIELYFQEDPQDVDEGYAPITGRISFRLMGESSEGLVESEARRIAQKVKTLFSSGSGFVWRKGREQVTYTDTERGYALRILCKSKAEGKRVVEQVLDIQSHQPDWKNLNHSTNEAPATRYSPTPRRQRIYGQVRPLPRQRPVGDVRFRYALLHLWGMTDPIVLVDRHNHYRQRALVEN